MTQPLLSLPDSYGSFVPIAGVVFEVPTGILFPRDALRLAHGIHACENFCAKVLPGLENKHAVKPAKESEVSPLVPSVSLCFWECTKRTISYADMEKQFPGRQKPVQWWGLTELLKQQHYGNLDLPFSLNNVEIMCFVPYRAGEKVQALAPVHSSVNFGARSPEWWVKLFEKDEYRGLCPEGAIFLSAEA